MPPRHYDADGSGIADHAEYDVMIPTPEFEDDNADELDDDEFHGEG